MYIYIYIYIYTPHKDALIIHYELQFVKDV